MNYPIILARNLTKNPQKPRFCARNARKQGFQTPKAHKNLDFVLGMPENRGSRPQKRTKMSILCSGSPKMGVPKANSAQKPRFCAREDVRGTGKAGIGTVKTRIAIGKRNRGLPANHRARSKNVNTL